MTEVMLAKSALISRLPPRRCHEPMLVTALRRYYRRGAPESLLMRLAGGPSHWRQLNETWNLDGRAADKPSPVTFGPIDAAYHLSAAERRIALVQLFDECAAVGALFPTFTALGACFGVTRHMIAYDLELLRRTDRISWHLRSDGATGVRRIPVTA